MVHKQYEKVRKRDATIGFELSQQQSISILQSVLIFCSSSSLVTLKRRNCTVLCPCIEINDRNCITMLIIDDVTYKTR